jgi:hypothetical protein
VALLKPRTDTLAPDAALDAASNASSASSAALKDSQGLPASGEWSNVAADLVSGKMRVGRVLNRLQETEKQKRVLLAESSAASAAASANGSAASSNLEAATAAAIRARGLGLLTQRIHSAKTRLADKSKAGGDGGAAAEDPLAWEEIADCSAQLFLQHVPNEGYLQQALKAYRRVESLSSEHLQKFPAFFLKRANLFVVEQDYAAAIADLERYSQIKGTVTVMAAPPASAPAAAAGDAAAFASSSSSAAPASSTPSAATVTLSYAALAAPRLHVVRQFVAATSRLLAAQFHLSAPGLSLAVQGLPNPSEQNLKRKLLPIASLKPGHNEGSALVARLLGKLDQSSLWSLASSTSNPRAGKGLEGSGVGLGPAVLPHQPYDALESRFRTPALYVIVDTQGRLAVLSLSNLAVDPSSAKLKARFKNKFRASSNEAAGSALVLLDPQIIEVKVEGEVGGAFTVVQVRNPYGIFSGSNHNDRRDIEQVFTAEDIAASAEQ